jgi:hypothetical protein
MNKRTKQLLGEMFDRFITYYANDQGIDFQFAKQELKEYGAIDYMMKWYPILGHGNPTQIAHRLSNIVKRKKALRREIAFV